MPERPPPLARGTVDRAAERRVDAAWLEAAWEDPASRVLLVAEGRTLVRSGPPAGIVYVRPAEAPPGERYLLGVDPSGLTHFAVAGDVLPERQDADPAGLRGIGALLDDTDAGLLVHAVALERWHRCHPRCAQCGEPTEAAAAGHARRCEPCGAEHFPRIDPAVIVLVTDEDDRCLLGRQSGWPEGRFSTLAGFVEPGESLEQAVVREVHEEVSVLVSDVHYVASQPWPFPSSLMVGFTARATDPVVRVDGVEIAEAHWFSRAEFRKAVEDGPLRPPPEVSMARRLLDLWLDGPSGG